MIELYNADCYEKIKDIPDNSVDLVIMDPPYLYTTAKGGGASGSKNRSYHAEYDSVSQHTPLDRSFIGIEIDKEYYEIAKKRIEDA